MSEQPEGNLDNNAISRFKHYSRPTQYTQRPSPKLFSDVTDQFAEVHQAAIDQTITQPASPVVQAQPAVPEYKQPALQPVQQSIAQPQIQPQPAVIPEYKQPISQPVQQATTKPQIQPQRVVPPVPVAVSPIAPQVDQLSQPEVQYKQPAAQPQPIIQQPQQVQQAPTQPMPAPQQFRQPEPVAEPVQQSAPPLSQIQAPIYSDNYSGEYEDQKKKRFSLKDRFSKKALVYSSSIAVTVLLAGTFVVFMSWNNNKNVAQAQATTSNNSSQSANSNTPVTYASASAPSISEVSSYNVAPNYPKYLIIPKLNIHSIIEPVSLNRSHLLDAPDNIYKAGWWSQSSMPGQAGATVIDGFTDNGSTSGLFSSLDSLSPGDTFKVEIGNGSLLTYKVIKTQPLNSAISMDQAISPVTPGTSSLNIITCSGRSMVCPSTSSSDFVLFSQEVN